MIGLLLFSDFCYVIRRASDEDGPIWHSLPPDDVLPQGLRRMRIDGDHTNGDRVLDERSIDEPVMIPLPLPNPLPLPLPLPLPRPRPLTAAASGTATATATRYRDPLPRPDSHSGSG